MTGLTLTKGKKASLNDIQAWGIEQIYYLGSVHRASKITYSERQGTVGSCHLYSLQLRWDARKLNRKKQILSCFSIFSFQEIMMVED